MNGYVMIIDDGTKYKIYELLKKKKNDLFPQ